MADIQFTVLEQDCLPPVLAVIILAQVRQTDSRVLASRVAADPILASCRLDNRSQGPQNICCARQPNILGLDWA